MKKFLLPLFCVFTIPTFSQGLKASFYAEESMKTDYRMGWDSMDEAKTWKYERTNSSATWGLADNPQIKGLNSFTSIDANNKYSLAINYSNAHQDETATSPEILLPSGAHCEFYSCFSGGFLIFARWRLILTDVETQQKDTLVDAFNWAQEKGYDGPSWVKFNPDLAKYAGRKVTFSFNYKGDGGEDVLIDGFRIMHLEDSPDAYVSINEGDTVHFTNASEGAVTSYRWTFSGADTESSTEADPKIVYSRAGAYPVTLTVSDGQTEHTVTRATYVKVNAVAPKAIIGVPRSGYLSPFAGVYLPLNVPVRFEDYSTGNPTEWYWQFQETDKLTTLERRPTVTFLKEGVYSVGLRVTNSAGSNTDALQRAIQVGGQQYIWNIAPEENSKLEKIALGWYGNYAGSNFLGITEFAEYFHAPLVSAEISSVDIYFATTTTITPDALVKVSVREVGDDGMPGQELGSAEVAARDLKYDAQNVVPTTFKFAEPVSVSKAFFVTVSGMPNENNAQGTDDIAIYCIRREHNEKNTVYHLLADEDDRGRRLGTYTWYENEDEALSMAVCPLMKYSSPTAVAPVKGAADEPVLAFDGSSLRVSGTCVQLQVYSAGGSLLKTVLRPAETVSLADLPAGVFVVKALGKDSMATLKILKK